MTIDELFDQLVVGHLRKVLRASGPKEARRAAAKYWAMVKKKYRSQHQAEFEAWFVGLVSDATQQQLF